MISSVWPDMKITGTNDWADTKDSDVVIITSGVARKPGMTREDLLGTNAGIVRSVVTEAAKASPDAVLIIFANPMDAMCHVALEASAPEVALLGVAGPLVEAGVVPPIVEPVIDVEEIRHRRHSLRFIDRDDRS